MTRTLMTAGRARAAEVVPRPACSLALRGGFELRIDGHPTRVPLSAQRVLAFLGLKRRRLGRVFVAGHLWTDASEERAAAALRTALWRLGRSAGALVCCEGQSLSLDPEVEVDVDVATTIARELFAEAGTTVAPQALAVLRDDGELLPDWYEDWVLIERERFRQVRLHALETLCRRLSAEGRHAEATEAGVAAVASEPLRESAHGALIAAHLAEHNPGEALRQYRLCRDLLRQEFDLAPSAQLDGMVAHLRHVTER
jgi:DNA-binding SARP family transcriptional activator